MATNDLAARNCKACNKDTPSLSPDQVREFILQVPGWDLTADGKRIARMWRVADFMEGLNFFQRIAGVAETEDHHPDLHLTDYRLVLIELWTHAAGGLTENDFIIAAKINALQQPKLKV